MKEPSFSAGQPGITDVLDVSAEYFGGLPVDIHIE
jgi:hypothetical protein